MRLLLIAALCAMGAGGAADALEQAGVSAAVRGEVQRANDLQPVGVQIASGQPIYLADRISSSANSGLQIMLLDQTTFTIGPDSFVKIDEFVYDPKTNVGKLTASLGKGVFRFVTGQIARTNPSDMTVKLPVATIGIRGTMVYGRADENSAIVGLAGAGPENTTGDKPAGIDVITPEGTAEVRRPGWGVIIERGKPPVVGRLPKPTVDAILESVAPRELVNALATTAGVSTAATVSGPADAKAASRASGQASAAALPSLATFAALNDSVIRFNGPIVLAAQNIPSGPIFPDGQTLFGQLASVVTGFGTYNQTGIALSGGGSYTFSMLLDFAARNETISWTNITVPGGVTNASMVGGGFHFNDLPPNTAYIIFVDGGCSSDTCHGVVNLSNANGVLGRQAVQTLHLDTANASGGSTVIRQ